ncbi:MAG: hypothetical protein M1541_09200 [Acidobacteria bacterium]|nr:hypothetical protein [Acidobacteriota bacterium]
MAAKKSPRFTRVPKDEEYSARRFLDSLSDLQDDPIPPDELESMQESAEAVQKGKRLTLEEFEKKYGL